MYGHKLEGLYKYDLRWSHHGHYSPFLCCGKGSSLYIPKRCIGAKRLRCLLLNCSKERGLQFGPYKRLPEKVLTYKFPLYPLLSVLTEYLE